MSDPSETLVLRLPAGSTRQSWMLPIRASSSTTTSYGTPPAAAVWLPAHWQRHGGNTKWTRTQLATFQAASAHGDHDVWASDPTSYFVNRANHDYHLTAGSPAISGASDGGDIGAFDYIPRDDRQQPAPDDGHELMATITDTDFEGSFPPSGYTRESTLPATLHLSSVQADNGTQSMRVNNAGSGAVAYMYDTVAGRVFVRRWYLRVAQKVGATADITTFTNAQGNVYLRLLTTGVIRLTMGTTNYAGPTLTDRTWYRIDIRVAVGTANGGSAGTTYVDWAVNGAAQTSRTRAQTDGRHHRNLARHRRRQRPRTCTSMTTRSPIRRATIRLPHLPRASRPASRRAPSPRRLPPRAWASRLPSRRGPARPTTRRSPSSSPKRSSSIPGVTSITGSAAPGPDDAHGQER